MATDLPDDLLCEARWLERLAAGLVGDAHAAADLAQDAWLAAERAAPTGRRAWLVATVRKLAARARRQRGRTLRREQHVARAEALPSAVELTARAEQHQRLIGHITALAEPYRVAILLRYYEGLPPREIAARLGLPVRTVHTRLQRALEQLRGRLDAEHPQGRAGWIGVLLLARVPPAPLALSGALAAVVVLLMGLRWWASAANDDVTSADSIGAELPASVATPAATSVGERRAVELAQTPRWLGTVVDLDGYPLPDVRIEVVPHLGLQFDGGDDETLELISGAPRELPQPSDRLGGFVAEWPTGAVLVRGLRPGWCTALAAVWRPGQTEPPRVVMAPARDVDLTVVDPQGRPLSGVQAWLDLHRDDVAPTQHLLTFRAVSDDLGRLRFDAVPDVPNAALELRLAGCSPRRCELAAPLTSMVTLVPEPHWRRAQVLDARGLPLAAAHVVVGSRLTKTDHDGWFSAALLDGADVGIAAPGYAPLLQRCDGAEFAPQLVLPASTLCGQLRDAHGRPAQGWEISLVDPTVAGAASRPRVLEALVAGRGGFVLSATTDVEGRFQLPGLAPRPYRLRVLDQRTVAQFTTPPLDPLWPAELVVPVGLLHAELQGQLTTVGGAPLTGASVVVQTHGYVVPGSRGGAPASLFGHGARTQTDAAGRFILHGVPRTGAWLRVDHQDTRRVELTVPEQLAQTPLTLVVPRARQLTVGCRAAATLAAALEVLDASGQVLAVRTLDALAERSMQLVPLREGRSPLLTVPEGAAAVRVRVGAGELAFARLTLRPDGPVHLEL